MHFQFVPTDKVVLKENNCIQELVYFAGVHIRNINQIAGHEI